MDGSQSKCCEGFVRCVLLVVIAVLETQFTARQQPRGLD